MQFYKHWAKSRHQASGPAGSFDVSCYGFSSDSLEDALAVAEQRAKATADSLAQGRPHDAGYYGSSHPFREEVVEEITDNDTLLAVISRNHYGCLVLNTENVFFADIDKPSGEGQKNPIQSLLNMFGVVREQPKTFEQDLVEKLGLCCSDDSNAGFRLYRTTNGYRVILTNQTVPAREARARNLLDRLGSDQLYISLCRSQDCYRARLTPKPWRCGADRPTIKFPFATLEEETSFRGWVASYESACQSFATCALIGQFGNQEFDPTVEKIVKLHDHFVLNGDLPLA